MIGTLITAHCLPFFQAVGNGFSILFGKTYQVKIVPEGEEVADTNSTAVQMSDLVQFGTCPVVEWDMA